KHWIEVEYSSIPEMDEPGDQLEHGFTVHAATDADREAIATVEAESTGLPRLSNAGLDSLYESARWLYVVNDASARPVGVVAMRRDGSWGLVDEVFILPELRE